MRRLLPLALVLGTLVGCVRAARPTPRGDEARTEEGGRLLGEGLASFYGEDFRGRLTASGERFRPEALTAAHRRLRFGTCVHVTNLENGRSVQVRVNDRGPFKPGRILDVSLGAARRLGMVDEGVVRVRLSTCGGRPGV